MNKNLGNIDRALRILLAVVFATLYFTGAATGIAGYIMLALGTVFALTSLVSFCPLYALFGVTTCSTKKEV